MQIRVTVVNLVSDFSGSLSSLLLSDIDPRPVQIFLDDKHMSVTSMDVDRTDICSFRVNHKHAISHELWAAYGSETSYCC